MEQVSWWHCGIRQVFNKLLIRCVRHVIVRFILLFVVADSVACRVTSQGVTVPCFCGGSVSLTAWSVKCTVYSKRVHYKQKHLCVLEVGAVPMFRTYCFTPCVCVCVCWNGWGVWNSNKEKPGHIVTVWFVAVINRTMRWDDHPADSGVTRHMDYVSHQPMHLMGLWVLQLSFMGSEALALS